MGNSSAKFHNDILTFVCRQFGRLVLFSLLLAATSPSELFAQQVPPVESQSKGEKAKSLETVSPENAEAKKNTASSSSNAESDGFNSRFDKLLAADEATDGRDNIVKSCEKLLSDFPDHSRRAEVMLRIAYLYSVADAAIGLEAKDAEYLEWSQKALDAAQVGSKSWAEASIGVADRLRSSAKTKEELAKAYSLLEQVAMKSDSPLMRLKGEFGLIGHFQHIKDGAGIEKQCKKVIDWKEDPSQKNKLSRLDLQAVNAMKLCATHELVHMVKLAKANGSIAPSHIKEATKKQQVEQVSAIAQQSLKSMAFNGNVTEEEQKKIAQQQENFVMNGTLIPAITRIDKIATSMVSARKAPLTRKGGQESRNYFVAINILVIAVLGVAIVLRRRGIDFAQIFRRRFGS